MNWDKYQVVNANWEIKMNMNKPIESEMPKIRDNLTWTQYDGVYLTKQIQKSKAVAG